MTYMRLGKLEKLEIYCYCFLGGRAMTCLCVSSRNLICIASVFLETNNDRRLAKLEELDMYCFCLFEPNADRRLAKLKEVDIHRFCFVGDES